MDSSQRAMVWLAVGFEIAGSVVIGVLVGWWCDGHYGTDPYGVLAGTLVGSATALQRLMANLRRFGGGSDEHE